MRALIDRLRSDERARARLVLGVLVVVFLASAARNIKEEGDFVHYVEAGARVLHGRDIYEGAAPDTVNTWPPLFAVVCVPFALLASVSVYLARGVWLAVNAVLVYAMLKMTVELVYRRPLTMSSRDGISVASLAFLGPLVLASRFLLGNFDRLQINLLILFCCLAGCRWVVRGRPLLGGAGGWPVRKGNQSLYAMVDRLYSHGALYWTPAAKRFKASDDPVVAAFVYGTLAVVALLFALAARRGGRTPRSPAVVVELAIVLAICVLFSPLAWKHYFVFLLLGYAALWRAAFVGDPPPADGFAVGLAPHLRQLESDDGEAQAWRLSLRERRRIAIMLAISFALTTLSVRGVVGKRMSLHLETISVVTIGALVATAALLYLRARLGARTE